ncbi:MAG TPA: methyl-accepting chemotaxis protein [Alcaligenes faecalis]|nr:methyl-accepting chemotaxis protein [Alcaligenes faecalis]
MRDNHPITQHETQVPDKVYLISKTDLQGRITYANPAFIEISGFSHEELIGSHHNIVRHPHMPSALFQDLWHTLQQQRPWSGLIKNRRKDGGFYWVKARVIPLVERGRVNGYASVRVRPSADEIAQAQSLYQSIAQHGLRGYRIQEGQLQATGWRAAARTLLQPLNRSLRASLLRFGMLTGGLLTLCAGLLAGSGAPTAYLTGSLGALSLVGLITLAYGWIVTQRMMRPLHSATHIAQQIATGNLLIELNPEHTRSQEVAQLYFYMDMMRKSLLGLARDVHQGIQSSLDVSTQLEDGNRQLSSRTSAQSGSLQRTAASMEELTITVQQTADNARLANQLADQSLSTARRGGEVVQDMVNTMQDIHNSSERIGDIVAMIEGLAFQTNILALNAAVESARAGEAGRGFAVVAGEVRSLAQKSAQAAGEIKTLVEDSLERMSVGARHADRARATMEEIMESVSNVTHLINEISTASNEQASGLAQINDAVSNMDRDTNDNADLALSLGHTVSQLSQQALELKLSIQLLNTGHRRSAYIPDPDSTQEPIPLLKVA